MMKKVLSIVLLLSLLMLSGCFNMSKSYELMQGKAEISKIELYYAVMYTGDPADGTAELVAELKGEDVSDFSQRLKTLPFKQFVLLLPAAIDPNFTYYGFFIKISYNDGACEYISDSGIQTLVDASGKKKVTHLSCDEDVWIKFLKKYFDEDLFDVSQYTVPQTSSEDTSSSVPKEEDKIII